MIKSKNYFNIEEYKLIKFSGLFDEIYYLKKYPDVQSSGYDPIVHYMIYGWKEGRNPSEKFNTSLYLNKYSDVKESKINPLIHYILYGKNEKRKKFAINKEEKFYENKAFFDTAYIPEINISHPIDILIPVYNGLNHLTKLLQSIIINTTLPYRLLIADDKSSDINVNIFLKNFKKEHSSLNIIFLENSENIGFVKTVNKLMSLTKNHFVILNSDTEVPSKWLERLIYPILSMKKIASTTPFTNSGLYCSFPEYLEDNKLFLNLSLEQIDNIFKRINFNETFIEVPSGIGFCMGINRNTVHEIGMFDEIFGKGFGEENDWCQRAIDKGYRNIHVTNLFIYHKHGGSFLKKEKNMLIKKNSEILLKKYPSFALQMKLFIENNQLKTLREKIKSKIIEYYLNL